MSNKNLPVKVLQIGEGNFLRAFAEYIIETADNKNIFNSSVVISQARGSDFCNTLNGQNCDYHILTRGIDNGKQVDELQKITCVRECINPKTDFKKVIETACLDSLEVIISNTTEAGISYHNGDKFDDIPPVSYPGKLTVLLYKRFEKFAGKSDKGLLILPVELIQNNGNELKKIVLKYSDEWKLGDEFTAWINNSCCFANTLVDRIVSGYPKENIEQIFERCGFEDKCITACEPFLFWAIECDEKFRDRFPVDKLGLNIVYSNDITPYKIRKVRILNGAHTMSVLAAYLGGHDIVSQMMSDSVFHSFIKNALQNEIIPTINLPKEELCSFSDSVLERFENPFIKHKLLDISLNSFSKYRARCLETLKDYIKINGNLPCSLVFGFAALICFYNGTVIDGKFTAKRNNDTYEIKDDEEVIKFMATHPNVKCILARSDFWGEDLNNIDGLENKISYYIESINTIGIIETVKEIR